MLILLSNSDAKSKEQWGTVEMRWKYADTVERTMDTRWTYAEQQAQAAKLYRYNAATHHSKQFLIALWLRFRVQAVSSKAMP